VTGFDPGPDPVPTAAREADPERDQRARQLEWEIEAEIHPGFDRPLDPDDAGRQEQRVTYIYHAPGREPHRPSYAEGPIPAGWIWWVRGAWWWRAAWGHPRDVDPLGLGERQVLEVGTEEEAILHARRRVAWGLAGAK
jgi:hypothetical protein